MGDYDLSQGLVCSDLLASILIDQNYTILTLSEAAKKYFQFTVSMLGERLDTFGEFEPVLKHLYHHISSQNLKTIEVACLYPSTYRMTWCYVEIITVNAKELRYVINMTDMSEAYQAQMLLEASMELGTDLFLFLDMNEKVLYGSEALAHLFGFEGRRNMIGIKQQTFLHHYIPKDYIMEAIVSSRSGKEYKKQLTIVTNQKAEDYLFQLMLIRVRGIESGYVIFLQRQYPEYNEDSLENSYLQSSISSYRQATMPLIREQRQYEINEMMMELLYEHLAAYEYDKVLYLIEELLNKASGYDSEYLRRIKKEVKLFNYDNALHLYEQLKRGEA